MTFPAGLAEDLGVHERTLRRAVNLGPARGGRRYHAQLGLAPGEEEYLRARWRLLRDLREGLRLQRQRGLWLREARRLGIPLGV